MDSDESETKQQKKIALDIKRDGERAQEQVKKLAKQLKKKIDDNEEKLLNKIQKSKKKADKNLRIIRHTPAAKEYIKYIIQNGTASEMIELQSDEKCSKTFPYNAFENDLGGMIFQPNENLCEQLDTGIGLIQSFKRADPNNRFKAVNANSFEAMKKSTLKVALRTDIHVGELCEPPVDDDLSIHITPEEDVELVEKHVTSDGQIEVTFTPRVPGQLTVEVKIHGTPVSNSPQVIDVKPQHIKEITTGSELQSALFTGSKYLIGIAVNKSNTRIAVADSSNCCVRVFNMDGDLLLSYGNKGNVAGQLKNPEGLAFLRNNEIDLVIADSSNHRICIVDTNSGILLRTFGCPGNRNGQFRQPIGIFVDDNSNIIVTDGSNRIQVFTKKGDYLHQITIPGKQNAFDVAAHNGLLYVSADKSVHVIKMEESQLITAVTTIGGEDYTDGRLHDAAGLAIDNDNNLLVCDYESEEIFKFRLDGRYVGKTNKLNYNPLFITVLNDGQIMCTQPKGVQFLR